MPFLRFGLFVRYFAPTIIYFDMTHVSDRDVGYRAFYLGPKTELTDKDDLLLGVDQPLSSWYRTLLAATRGASERIKVLTGFAGLSRFPLEHEWFRDELEGLRSGGSRTRRQFDQVTKSLHGVGTRKLSSFQKTIPLFNSVYLHWLQRQPGTRDPQVVKSAIEEIEKGKISSSDRTIFRVPEEYSRVFSDEFLALVRGSQATDWTQITRGPQPQLLTSAGTVLPTTSPPPGLHSLSEINLSLIATVMDLLERAYAIPENSGN